jgi:CDP-diacylglycerol--glycerol-3-phosphate 3-phosphatidyltransferase
VFLTTANVLSLGRIVLTLLAAVIYVQGYRPLALLIGAVAGFTDLFDGWIARRLGQTSDIGAMLDRLGDLVFETVALVVLSSFGLLSPVYLLAYLFREFAVLSLRQHAARHGIEVPSRILGKLKTHFLGFGACAMLLVHAGIIINAAVGEVFTVVGQSGITVGLLFSYVSGWQYLRSTIRETA